MYHDILKGKSICSGGFCMDRVKSGNLFGSSLDKKLYKSKADVEKDCLAEPTCKAYDYSEYWGYGGLCDSVENYGARWSKMEKVEVARYFEICSITSRWNIMISIDFLFKKVITTY